MPRDTMSTDSTRDRQDDCARILAFHAGTGPDHRGRRIADVLAYDHEALELHHDYIQWLFPLEEPSGVMPFAPRLDPACRAAFARDPACRAALRRAFATMCDFYGFVLDERQEPPRLARGPHFAARAREWVTPGNHNFLRLTRILKCLVALDEAPRARALLACLEAVHAERSATIGARTLAFWRGAVPAA
jgi:hypothetical protein